jgi:dTDP-D-glucose 4,6-dehydratase
VYDKMDYCASARNLEEVAACPRFKLIRGDVCDADLLQYVLREQGVDTVLHFAAQTHVDLSFWNSLDFTKNNTWEGGEGGANAQRGAPAADGAHSRSASALASGTNGT